MSQRGRLIVLFVTLVFVILGIGLMLPVVPMLVRELTGGEVAAASAIYGWLIALYSLMQFGCGPAMGALSDRFGRRPVLLVSLVGLSLDYLLLAVAPTIWWVVVARIIGGAMGASISTASAYIADITPPERRAQNFGLIGVAFGIGFVAGPLIGGVLGEYGSRVPFYAASAVGVVALIFAWFLLGESLAPENRRAFRLREANPVGALMVVARYPAVVALMAVFVLTQLAERMLEANWVLFTAYKFDWSAAQVGLSLAFVGLCSVIAQGGLVRLVVPAIGEWRTITGGIVIATVCMVLLAVVSQPWMIYAIVVPYVLGWGLTAPAIQALVTRAVPANEQGILQGAISSTATATGIVAPPVSGGLFAYFIGSNAPVHVPGIAFLVGAALFVAGLVVALRRSAPIAAASGEGAG
jgi:DHA1 family tetracycline resistance protein-like MFS transporter